MPTGTWKPCPCDDCKGQKTPPHAIVTLHDTSSGQTFGARVPYAHRYASIGWGARPRLRWHGLDGTLHHGLEVARGPQGVTAITEDGQHHKVLHHHILPPAKPAKKRPAAELLRKAGIAVLTWLPLLKEAERKHPALKPGQRWITVHPNGEEGHGVPILIQEEKDGSHRVIGGAGGKLTHLRLHNVKSKEEHAKEAADRAKEKRAKEKERTANQSDEDKEAEATSKAELKDKKTVKEREFIDKVRKTLGGVDEDLDAGKLDGLSEGARNTLEARHHRKMLDQATQRVKEATEKAAADEAAKHKERAAIDQTVEADPDRDAFHKAAAEETAAEEKDKQERATERRARQSRTPAGSGPRDKAAEAAGEHIDAHEPADSIDGLEAKEAAASKASEKMGTRAAISRAKAKHLRDAAKHLEGGGELDRDLHTYAQDAIDGAEIPGHYTPQEARAAQVQVLHQEAARHWRKGERQDARAESLRKIETVDGDEEDKKKAEAKARNLVAFTDLVSGIADEAKAAKDMGLTDTARVPLKQSEVAEIHELLQDKAKLRAVQQEYREMVKAVEKGDFDASRRAFTLSVDKDPPADIHQTLLEETQRQLTEQLLGMVDPNRPAHMQAVAAGHHDALSDVGLAIGGQRMVDRRVVDALGAKNAAILTAHALQEAGHDKNDLLNTIESYHVEQVSKAAADALARVEKIVPGLNHTVEAAGDFQSAAEKLDALEADLDEAQHAVGSAIGRLEGTATLAQVLREKSPEHLAVQYRDSSEIDGTQAWLHSLGLSPADYHLDYDAKEVRIPQAAWSKLIRPLDEKAIDARKTADAIKAGKHDEEGWLPPGIVRREASTFTAPVPDPPRLREPMDWGHPDPAAALARHVGSRLAEGEPPQEIAADLLSPGQTAQAPDKDAYTAQVRALFPMRTPEGEQAHAAAGELDGLLHQVKGHTPEGEKPPHLSAEDHRLAHFAESQGGEARARLAAHAKAAGVELGEDGAHAALEAHQKKLQREGMARKWSDMTEHFEGLAKRFMEEKYGSETGAFHAQDIQPGDPGTHEAIFRALAEHPRAAVAWKGTGELSPQEQAVLREHFYASTGQDPSSKGDEAAYRAAMEKLGPEPSKEGGSLSMFGGGSDEPSDAWRQWDSEHRAVLQQYPQFGLEEAIGALGPTPDAAADPAAHAAHQAQVDHLRRTAAAAATPWSQYVHLHGSTELAQRAMQDDLKGKFLHSFREHYGKLTGRSLRLGVAEVTNRERHVAATDKEAAERIKKERASVQSRLRDRVGGKFAGEGAVVAKHNRWLEQSTISDQNQLGMFGAAPLPEAEGQKPPDLEAGERHTIGERAENQIGSLMPHLAQNIKPGQKPVKLFGGLNMDGERVHQQRALRMLDQSKRLGGFLGTGSGKSLISIAGFTQAHAKGECEHGLFIVPKAVEEQFGGEMLRYTRPGAYKFDTGAGKGHAERVAMLKDKGVHMRVMTHQAFRDTALRLMAEHHQRTPDQMREQLAQVDRHTRARWMREAFDAHGIPSQYVYYDEAHQGTERGGEATTSSLIKGAITHPDNATHALLGTATPTKNDATEMASWAADLDPHTYGDSEKFLQNHGQATAHNPWATRRELNHLTYTARVLPENVTRTVMDNPSVGEDGKLRESGPLPLHPDHQAQVDQVMAHYQRAKEARDRGEVDVEALKALSPSSFRRKESQPPRTDAEIAHSLHPSLGIIKEAALRRAIDQAHPDHNTKLQAMTRVIKHELGQQWRDSTGRARDGHAAIVHVDSAESAQLVHEHLKRQGVRSALYHGGLSTQERGKIMAGFQPEDGSAPQHDVIVMTAAGEAGINCQRATRTHHYDVPMTDKSWQQRSGRTYRQGQTGDVNAYNWHTDTDYEKKAKARLKRKEGLAEVFQSPLANLDDTGIALHHQRVLAEKHQGQVLPGLGLFGGHTPAATDEPERDLFGNPVQHPPPEEPDPNQGMLW